MKLIPSTGGLSMVIILSALSALSAPTITNVSLVPRIEIQSDLGVDNEIQFTTDVAQGVWETLTNVVVTRSPYTFVDAAAPRIPPRFYRVVLKPAPTNMVIVPTLSFTMGDAFSEGLSNERPLHEVQVSAFYFDRFEVTKSLWDEVAAWAADHGYSFDSAALGKAGTHPVNSVSWYDAVKWCNARSEKENRVAAYYTDAGFTQVYRSGKVHPFAKWNAGYRLPTEAEWERAARPVGGQHRFPWSDVETISHTSANFFSRDADAFDNGTTRGYHPAFATGDLPYTAPAGSFAANDLGIYDLAGNVQEWCWDWYDAYQPESQADPRGTSAGSDKMLRGGAWSSNGWECRVARRTSFPPDYQGSEAATIGFRCVLPK